MGGGDLRGPPREDQVGVGELALVGLGDHRAGLHGLRVAGRVVRLLVGDVPKGVPTSHDVVGVGVIRYRDDVK